MTATPPTHPPAFRTVVEPAMDRWPALDAPSADLGQSASGLAHWVNLNADLLGSEPLSSPGPYWVTGHQAWLWHPGILAKDIAAAAAASRFGGQAIHLVVDHDIHNALDLDLPIVDGDLLRTRTLQLAATRTALPAACQGPADASQAIQTLRIFRGQFGSVSPARLDELEQALTNLPACDTLGQQMAIITHRLMKPWTGPLAILLTSQLCQLEGFRQIIHDMLHDAVRCARAYNQAVTQHPQAGIGPLAMDSQLVELPLWLVTWGKGRQPVYADLADSRPLMVTADGQPVRLGDWPHGPILAPRAMLLTAAMRRHYARLFIHGTGGGVYDRVTEAWWSNWKPADRLSPMAVVTADLRMAFDVPVAAAGDVQRAVWWAHHLPHNLDRLPDLPASARLLAQEKAGLLHRLAQEKDRRDKAADFDRVHAINDELARLMPDVLARAQASLAQTRQGVDNHAQASRRDWCFALYDHASLARLGAALGMPVSAADKPCGCAR